MSGVAAALLIALGVLVICDMVVERYVLSRTTIWQIDVVTYSIVAATFIGSPYVLLTRGHVNVDVLPLHVGPRARWWLALVDGAAGAFLLRGAVRSVHALLAPGVGPPTGAPTPSGARACGFPMRSMPIGLGLLVLQYVAELIGLATGERRPSASTTHEGHGHEPDDPGR